MYFGLLESEEQRLYEVFVVNRLASTQEQTFDAAGYSLLPVFATTVPHLLKFRDVSGQQDTPVQGLGFPDGPDPDDWRRL